MKYTNLVDAVTGIIYEGKSYKRNKDEDVDAKKKEDKQKRDNKKEPVAEAVDPEQRRKTLRSLIKKTKDLAIEHSDKPSKQKHYENLTAKYQEELDSLKGKKVAEDVADSLEEAYGRGWAILPATVALYGKKVVDIKTAASEWASDSHPTTILVCSKHQDGRNRMLFLSSSGDCRTQYKVGQASETYHDQTGASKGVYTVENVVVFQGGEIVYQANNKGLTGKASVAVFK